MGTFFIILILIVVIVLIGRIVTIFKAFKEFDRHKSVYDRAQSEFVQITTDFLFYNKAGNGYSLNHEDTKFRYKHLFALAEIGEMNFSSGDLTQAFESIRGFEQNVHWSYEQMTSLAEQISKASFRMVNPRTPA